MGLVRATERVCLFIGTLLLLVCVPSAALAAEETTRLFDATLSLTGNCETSGADPVADPGCPGGTHPPAGRFDVPKAVATDSHGDIYVLSTPISGEGGLVDVFSPTGLFITEINEAAVGESLNGPHSIAVDSEGHVYLMTNPVGERRLVRYDPAVPYEPALGKIKYEDPAVPVVTGISQVNTGIAVDPSEAAGHKDRLYLNLATHVNEYKSAAEGNALVSENIGSGTLFTGKYLAIDPTNHDIYASGTETAEITSPSLVNVYDGTTHALIRTIKGDAESGPACPAGGKFSSGQGYLSIGIDSSNGHVFVYDAAGLGARAVYEFNETGSECISKIERGFTTFTIPPALFAIDNGTQSPNVGYLYVPSGKTQAESHLWAFEPFKESAPPVIEELEALGITATGAEVKALINPERATTHYTLKYEVKGSGEPHLAKEGTIPAGNLGVEVATPLGNLEPATTYRVWAYAENECETVPLPECNDEAEISFTTYPLPDPLPPCPKDELREVLGLSAALPDCRAYELVTPPDTGGKVPSEMQSGFGTDFFASPTAAPGGGRLGFMTLNGSLPGTEAGGGVSGSPYMARRDPEGGWSSESIGLSGTQASVSAPGGLSPDLMFNVVQGFGSGTGSLLIGGGTSNYVRHADGSFHLIGEGLEESDPNAQVRYISVGGSHVIFTSASHLVENSPAKGVIAIYDRAEDGLHLISLLPSGGASTESSFPQGVSADGVAIAFKTNPIASSPLYLHIGGETLEATAAPEATFAGLSADGRYLFYLSAGGDLFRFDSQTEATEQVSETGDAVPVNVASSGDAAFFVSQTEIPGSGSNPEGAEPITGEENLYRWSEGGGTEFIATVTQRDVEGELSGSGGSLIDGLGLWAASMKYGDVGRDPSRTTADGNALLFESRADLTGYDSEGKAEIYRFDSGAATLACLSCNPTGAAAEAGASLQSIGTTIPAPQPLSPFALVPNLSANGNRAFFETSDRLVIGDTNHSQDVYEWEEGGTGSCATEGGCVYLISSGQSSTDDYLYGVSETGSDVFIWTTQRLLNRDADETPSIYDARVEGGFAEPEPPICEAEACKPGLTPAPPQKEPESGLREASGNPTCPKGKHRVVREGGSNCVTIKKKHHKKRHHRHKKKRHKKRHRLVNKPPRAAR
jgi:hypothetical protein